MDALDRSTKKNRKNKKWLNNNDKQNKEAIYK